ncbi:MAG: hypothetical protein EXS03_06965 [Phycisphaerales bacterium]|nr:hypothetical protein [Phycisphaerales bacterium]
MLNAIAALGFLVALGWGIGRVVTDSWVLTQYLHWIPSVAAIAASAACSVILAVGRRRHLAATLLGVALVAAGVTLAQDWRPWGPSLAASASRAGVVRVAHFNANWPGATSAMVAHALATSIHDAFALAGADVVFVSEPGGVVAAAELRGMIPSGIAAVSLGRFAVISRLPIAEAIPLFDDGSSAGALIRFDATSGVRAWSAVILDAPSDVRRGRVEVMQTIRTRLAERGAANPDLMLGDFNAVRGGASLTLVASPMRNAFDLGGSGWGGTFPRALPLWHIDNIFVDPEVRVLAYEAIDPGIGQHRIQAAVLEFGVGAGAP